MATATCEDMLKEMLQYMPPIPMVLHCPSCGQQHIDGPDEDAHAHSDGHESKWTNPPHRSHLCAACGCIWRPADVPTVGVEAIETKGKADNFSTAMLAAVPSAELSESRAEFDGLNLESEVQRLVDFFRSKEGYRHFGREGDQMDWTPAQTAINAMQNAIKADTFQYRVGTWMDQCFLTSLYSNMIERGDRLLEEVLELLQSKGYDRNRVATLVDYVWSRPAGDPSQEVGGVMVTLAGFCYIAGLDMYRDGEKELARINVPEVMEKIKRKQEAKNALHFDTPLPGDPGKEG